MNAGNGAAQVSINPAEVAQAALMFMGRADFRAHERRMFDLVESLLKAMAEGTVSVTQTPPAPAEPPPPDLDA